jgi:uncharacterized protein YxjI
MFYKGNYNITVLLVVLAGLLALAVTGCVSWRYEGEPPGFGIAERDSLNKYIVKQKIWSWGDDFVIKDEAQNPVFYVKGKVFSIGDKLSFRDVHGVEMAYISQKVLSFNKKYRIFRYGRLAATVKKKITLFNDKFTVDVQGADGYEVTGNFWDYEYTFTRGGKMVAMVAKDPYSWSDTYGVWIEPGEDDVLILAVAIVIDMASHKDEEHHVDCETGPLSPKENMLSAK